MSRRVSRVYYGWFVAAAAAGTEFANAASAIGILTIFVSPMTEEFGWSRTQISGATSLGAIIGASLAPFTGRMVDRVGSRLLLAGGGIVVALACFSLAEAQTLLGFYIAFTFARTADQGMIKAGASPTVGKWFHRHRGRAVSLVFFAGSAGILVMAPIVQMVISARGWRAAWWVLGGVMLVVGVAPSALVVRRQPEDMGLVVDGATAAEPPPNQTTSPAEVLRASPDEEAQWQLSQVVRTPAFWLLMVSLLISSTASSGVGLHLIPHLNQQGIIGGPAVAVISVMSASGAVSTLVLGFISDRVAPKRLMVMATLMPAFSMTVLITADSPAEAYLFAMIQGVATTGVNTLSPLVWASFYGRASLGSIYGVSRASQVVGFATGALISGVIYDATGSYQDAFVLFGSIAVVCSTLVLITRLPARPATTQA
ncbi:MAG: MFS transporter [Dehalococcoidia bacterium]|nr:MFS transporter [Dehalococcoidia bacterium]